MASDEKLVSVRIDGGIAYICIDVEGENVNTLSPAMSERMEEVLEGLKRESGLEVGLGGDPGDLSGGVVPGVVAHTGARRPTVIPPAVRSRTHCVNR